MTDRIRILGIDPGSRFTGFGVVDFVGDTAAYVASGTIKSPDGTFPERLRKIFESVGEVVAEYRPAVVSIESVFMARNAGSALKLGQARGISLLVPASAGLSVAEYAPNMVKKAVVGAGHAHKDQIGAMINLLLPQCKPDSADAADALAVAITHAHHRRTLALDKLAG